VLALAAAAPSGAAAAARVAPCVDRPEVDCASVTVPLDRSGGVPGTLSLHVERWAPRAPRGVLFLLAGGPGQASTRAFDVGSSFWQNLFPGYALVTFDPRGTGRSGALDCPELDVRLPPAVEPPVAACARRLGAARRFYATTETAHDLDAVRAAIGAPRIALAGVSYGTKVALVYAAAYPGRVERLVLDSVVPPEGPDAFALSTLRAVPAAARAMCAARACTSATADFGADVVALANRIGREPLRGTVTDAAGKPQRVELWGTDLIHLVIRADSEPGVRAELPAAVNAAVGGRPRQLLRLVQMLRTTEPPPQIDVFSPGTLAATLCADITFPWPRDAGKDARRGALDAAAAGLPPGSTGRLGTWATSFGSAGWCLDWPDAGPQPGPPPLPDVPLLALAGEVDIRTPPADARAVVGRVPSGRLLLARGVGHAVLFTSASACAGEAIGAWLAGRTPRSECPRVKPQVATVPRTPSTFTALARGSGAKGRLRRTLVAVRATLAEARAAFRIALVQSRWGAHEVTLPGVLAGRLGVPLGASRVELTGYGYAPGVSVVGGLAVVGDPVDARLSGAVRVCGRSAARGVVVLSAQGGLRGVLGGRRVGARGALPAVAACTRR
jgi:pimeloyl-ACP methyl ester carboxylesterase